MESSRATDLKVGIVSLLGVTILILGLMWGKQRNIGVAEQTLRIHFPNSAGLAEGDVVSVNGVKKGRVASVSVVDDGVLVETEIEAGVQLHADATASIMMLELMGGKQVEIAPGTSNAPFDRSTVMQGTTSEDIPGAVAMLGDVSGDIKRVMFRLDTLLASMNAIMGDTQMIRSVRNSIANLDAAVTMARTFLAQNTGDMHETLVNVKTLVSEVKDFVEKNRATLDHALHAADTTVVSAGAAIARADSTISSINRMLDQIQHGGGAATTFLYDKQFASRLDSTLADAHTLMQFILAHGVNVNLRLGTRP